MKDCLCIGVDIGGTKIEATVLRLEGGSPPNTSGFAVLSRQRVPTERARGYEAILAAVAACVRSTAKEAGVDVSTTPIGVGMPGSVTRRDGLVKNSNTVCLNGRPFRDDLTRELGHAIRFENDANCFALAEAILGAGRRHAHGIVFGVILGTGVGGGIIIEGRIWPGAQSIAGEFGHHAVGPWVRPGVTTSRPEGARDAFPGSNRGISERPVCYCGKTGCFELYASGASMEREYRERSGTHLALAEIARRRDSDRHAAAVVDEMLEAFGRGLANLIDVLDPTVVVLGGGVSNLDLLYSEGVDRISKYVFNDELLTPILRHELGDSAGVFGAALLGAASSPAM